MAQRWPYKGELDMPHSLVLLLLFGHKTSLKYNLIHLEPLEPSISSSIKLSNHNSTSMNFLRLNKSDLMKHLHMSKPGF